MCVCSEMLHLQQISSQCSMSSWLRDVPSTCRAASGHPKHPGGQGQDVGCCWVGDPCPAAVGVSGLSQILLFPRCPTALASSEQAQAVNSLSLAVGSLEKFPLPVDQGKTNNFSLLYVEPFVWLWFCLQQQGGSTPARTKDVAVAAQRPVA